MVKKKTIIVHVQGEKYPHRGSTSSVRPKPGSSFGVGIGVEIFFSTVETFFFHFFFFNFFFHTSHIPLLGSFYKLEAKPRSSKIIKKCLKFGSKFGFMGLLMMEKLSHNKTKLKK